MRPPFLDDVSTTRSTQTETGRRACVMNCHEWVLYPYSLQDDVDEDDDDDDDDEDKDDDDDDDDEESDEEEEETWQV
jgi:hypothetical protein